MEKGGALETARRRTGLGWVLIRGMKGEAMGERRARWTAERRFRLGRGAREMAERNARLQLDGKSSGKATMIYVCGSS